MDSNQRIRELEDRIARLPKGSVSKKTVKGRAYHYRRWYEGGKLIEKYVSDDSLDQVLAEIGERKKLESELDALRSAASDGPGFRTAVYRGDALSRLSDSVAGLRTRECFEELRTFVESPPSGKVLVLYGLRRTGKTTMIRQAIRGMDGSRLSKAAFVQCSSGDTMADMKHDLDLLMEGGCDTVFIDEVTSMSDFIDTAALFSDIFAVMGMRIVLSGTDSLGFAFAECSQLYDRCIMLHTTFIPYRDFERVLGIRGIDEYIRYGGTMCIGGSHYNGSPFSSSRSADAYVDSAIAQNIQNSLRGYEHGGRFDHLRELYDRNELTNAINRVVEDMNHRFALDVLVRDFESHDLGVSASNLLRDRADPTDILYAVDRASVTGRLWAMLDVLNSGEASLQLSEAHVGEIKEYLMLLDLVRTVDTVRLPYTEQKMERALIAQPGLRYSQALALIDSLVQDPVFAALSLGERNRVRDRILDEVRGRMMEDIVLLETSSASPGKNVFVARFAVGEFDMVVSDPVSGTCEVYEIKHSAELSKAQLRHLLDEEKISLAEHRYGPVAGRFLIYRGAETAMDGIRCLNVEDYLLHIADGPARERDLTGISCRSPCPRLPSHRRGTCRSAPSPP